MWGQCSSYSKLQRKCYETKQGWIRSPILSTDWLMMFPNVIVRPNFLNSSWPWEWKEVYSCWIMYFFLWRMCGKIWIEHTDLGFFFFALLEHQQNPSNLGWGKGNLLTIRNKATAEYNVNLRNFVKKLKWFKNCS